jgi:hypothetical protein
MQRAAIDTCNRKFVPKHNGRLTAVHADATELTLDEGSADVVAICETHVTEHAAQVSDEDRALFA